MRKWMLFSLIMFVMLNMITNKGMAQEVPIKGTVHSEDGVPLPGVTVTVVGTDRATVTDMDGKFTVTASAGSLLEFSYVGYSKQRIKAKAGMTVQLSIGESGQM